MANHLQLLELDDLTKEVLIRMQASLDSDCLDDFFEFGVAGTGWVDTGEQVSKQAMEDRQVVGDNLGEVEVAESAHQHGIFAEDLFGTLHVTGDDEHRLDRAKTPVIMLCLREKVTA